MSPVPHPSLPVVIVGADCGTGLQAARRFRANGLKVIGIASDPDHPCTRGRAYSRIVVAKSEGEGSIPSLLELAPELPEGAVLLPCTDLDVIAISRHRAALDDTYRMALPPVSTVELLADKVQFAGFLTEHGLPAPSTRVLWGRSDAVNASRALAFPCLLKPSVKTLSWKRHTPDKVLIVQSPSELLERYDECSSWSPALIAQEWIQGEDTDHFTCNCYIGADGESKATFCTRKLRQWPARVGQGCLSVEADDPVVRDLTLEVFRIAGHRGLGYLEMKRDSASGRYLIIEANVGRPTGRSAAAEAAGVELLMTTYCDLVGAPLPDEREQRFRGYKWIDIRHDLQASLHLVRERRESIWSILRSWRGVRSSALFSWRDPVPFLTDLARTLRRKVSSGSPSPDHTPSKRHEHSAEEAG